MSAKAKIFTALRFFASGYFKLDPPSVKHSIIEVLDAFEKARLSDEFIRFPSTLDELRKSEAAFYRRFGFPGVVGCIDCTHVAIVAPSNSKNVSQHLYVNRKKYHSINVQLICDSRLRITNVNPRFPGKAHNSRIWNSSKIKTIMEEVHKVNPNQFHLIGDSAYALRPWMLTPIEGAAEGSPESEYSECQMEVHSAIKRVNGLLKKSFRCLLHCLHFDPVTATRIVKACCVLHNMLRDEIMGESDSSDSDDAIESDDSDDSDDSDTEYADAGIISLNYNQKGAGESLPETSANPQLTEGRMKQQKIVKSHFNYVQ
ncbi:putative nuclease HARBI1 [Phlebotomus argentipes]|uniref:putative nuclease HARBI1 n=1 Tax=Phlebotomus argentipes TaxID=94469 RepID=UPI002893641A|nr:putative nuclease HARBI1 [Phlebotomus argentipes]